MSAQEKLAKPAVRVGLPPDLFVPNLRIDTPARSYAENKEIAGKLCKDHPGLGARVIEMDVIEVILNVGWNMIDFNHLIEEHSARLGLEVQERFWGDSSASVICQPNGDRPSAYFVTEEIPINGIYAKYNFQYREDKLDAFLLFLASKQLSKPQIRAIEMVVDEGCINVRFKNDKFPYCINFQPAIDRATSLSLKQFAGSLPHAVLHDPNKRSPHKGPRQRHDR